MALSTTPRTGHAKDLVEALQQRDVALASLKGSLEKLEVFLSDMANFKDFAPNADSPTTCEVCDMPFIRSEADVKTYEWRCQTCRPAPKCDECDEELSGKEEGMCNDCMFNFHL